MIVESNSQEKHYSTFFSGNDKIKAIFKPYNCNKGMYTNYVYAIFLTFLIPLLRIQPYICKDPPENYVRIFGPPPVSICVDK